MTAYIKLGAAAFAVAFCLSGMAVAAPDSQSGFTYSAVYTADVQGFARGGPRAGRYLDNLDLTADLDLEKAIGWRSGAAHAYVLNNSGGAPNDLAQTLQGVNNIEVARPRLRLFELWLQQGFAGDRGSVRTGLYNLNSEFYSNEAAGALIAPAFGIGSELAATGPNGPSIFPSTGLGVRVNLNLAHGAYVRAAVLNAKSGVVGDPGGVDLSFGDGVLSIGEIGVERAAQFSAGAWRYSRKQDDIRDLAVAGDPVGQIAQGAYVLVQRSFMENEAGQRVVAFLRAGASDGDTTPFQGGWQAGVRVDRPFAGRPDSILSVGLQQGILGDKFRANMGDLNAHPARAESGLEVTYIDRLGPRLVVQPDFQWIHHAGGDAEAQDRWLVGLRVKVDLVAGGDK